MNDIYLLARLIVNPKAPIVSPFLVAGGDSKWVRLPTKILLEVLGVIVPRPG